MAPFKSMFHFATFVQDFKASYDFYSKLGFEKMFELKEEGADEPWYCSMKLPQGPYIELPPVNPPSPHPSPLDAQYYTNQTIWHFSLETDDMNEMCRDLMSKGITVWSDPMKTNKVTCREEAYFGLDRCYIAWIEDPDGNKIECMEQAPDSLQRQCGYKS